MAGTRQTNTFGEMLQKMLPELAKMKLAPDADMPFIIDLETKVIGKLREGIDGAENAMATAVPGDPMLGQAIGMQGQMPPPMPGGMGGGMGPGGPGGGMPGGMPPAGPSPEGVNGVASMPSTPSSPDELRRILGIG